MSIFGHFEAFWPFWPPSSHQITLKLKLKSRYEQLLPNKLFDSSTGNPSNGLKMAAMGPKMAENFQNSMILKKHTFVPELSYKIVKKLIFLHKMLYFVDFWPFWGFLAILTPFQSSDHSEIKILALWAIKSRYEQLLLNKLFDLSTGNPSNGLKMALKWPTISKSWLKRSKNDKMGA